MTVERRKYTREFKVNVVEAYESGKSVAELTREYDLHANLVYKWTQEYRNNPTGSFRGSGNVLEVNVAQDRRISELEQMIGRLTMEMDFLKKVLKHAETALVMKNPKDGQS
jgi:transposase